MSIRYKFIISLLLLTGTCLAIYIGIATSVFQNDKEVSIFEGAGKTSSAQAFGFKQSLQEDIEFSKNLISIFSESKQGSTTIGSDLLKKKNNLIALGVQEQDKWPFFQSKDPSLKPIELSDRILASPNQSVFVLQNSGLVALVVPLKSETAAAARNLVMVIQLHDQLQNLEFTAVLGGSFLAGGSDAISAQSDFPFAMAQGFVKAVPFEQNMRERTSIEKNGDDSYLISARTVDFGDLRVFTVVPKNLAFQGLQVLYKKSLQFFALIFSIVLIVSVLMTQTLLRNLDRLTHATQEISAGNFNFHLEVRSKDEFGKVATSFEEMLQEIKRLLSETKEKARMESELKTAQAVQENLFPAPSYSNNSVEINGLYRPASECGGDWWYYFEHPTGLYVFICDATGHGAPAALITAAAKAAVNVMKRDPQLTLLKLVEAFNFALFETAGGKLQMTGFVIQIRTDQTACYVNASHEPPLLFGQGSSESMDFIIDPIGPRFGQDLKVTFKVGELPSLAGQFLLMYTDGITSQLNADGREVGDRKFTKYLKNFDFKSVVLSDVNSGAFALVDSFREAVPQADDLTIVSLRFPAAKA